jgi:hypothetical protein
MYFLGHTENKDFPIILTIGWEQNYDDVLTDKIGEINIDEFSSMPGGVCVTAYAQSAKQFIGGVGSSGHLK